MFKICSLKVSWRNFDILFFCYGQSFPLQHIFRSYQARMIKQCVHDALASGMFPRVKCESKSSLEPKICQNPFGVFASCASWRSYIATRRASAETLAEDWLWGLQYWLMVDFFSNINSPYHIFRYHFQHVKMQDKDCMSSSTTSGSETTPKAGPHLDQSLYYLYAPTFFFYACGGVNRPAYFRTLSVRK